MQLLCSYSEENDTDCLDIVPVKVKKFREVGLDLKIPQIGWNNIYELRSPLFKNVKEDSFIYNVHSFFAEDSQYTLAKCNYGLEYASAIGNKNFYGVQFHTEKSAAVGEQILSNFLDISA